MTPVADMWQEAGPTLRLQLDVALLLRIKSM